MDAWEACVSIGNGVAGRALPSGLEVPTRHSTGAEQSFLDSFSTSRVGGAEGLRHSSASSRYVHTYVLFHSTIQPVSMRNKAMLHCARKYQSR